MKKKSEKAELKESLQDRAQKHCKKEARRLKCLGKRIDKLGKGCVSALKRARRRASDERLKKQCKRDRETYCSKKGAV